MRCRRGQSNKRLRLPLSHRPWSQREAGCVQRSRTGTPQQVQSRPPRSLKRRSRQKYSAIGGQCRSRRALAWTFAHFILLALSSARTFARVIVTSALVGLHAIAESYSKEMEEAVLGLHDNPDHLIAENYFWANIAEAYALLARSPSTHEQAFRHYESAMIYASQGKLPSDALGDVIVRETTLLYIKCKTNPALA